MTRWEEGSLPGQHNVIGLKLFQDLIETKAITEANSIWGHDCWRQPKRPSSSRNTWASPSGKPGSASNTVPLQLMDQDLAATTSVGFLWCNICLKHATYLFEVTWIKQVRGRETLKTVVFIMWSCRLACLCPFLTHNALCFGLLPVLRPLIRPITFSPEVNGTVILLKQSRLFRGTLVRLCGRPLIRHWSDTGPSVVQRWADSGRFAPVT